MYYEGSVVCRHNVEQIYLAWVLQNIQLVSEVLGTIFEGLEQYVYFLFVELEKRMVVKKKDEETTRKAKKKRGEIRELKRLQTFISYDGKNKKHKEMGLNCLDQVLDNILSWNVRRLNQSQKRKRNIIKGCLSCWKPKIVCLQETKLEVISDKIIKSLWCLNDVSWINLPALGSDGSILLIWNKEKVDYLTILLEA